MIIMAKAAADHRSEHSQFTSCPYQDPAFALFVFLYRLREEIRARKPLPRYVERDRRGNLSFRIDQSARTALPNDPTTLAFRRAYNAALVNAIAAEADNDE